MTAFHVIRAADKRLEARRLIAARPGTPTLVLLHEGLGCVAAWKDFPDRLAAATGCGVLVYSRAGYGGSDPVSLPRPLTYLQDEAEHGLPSVLDAEGIDRAVLVGHSDGASIALIHAGMLNDSRVAGVVAMAPHVFNEEKAVSGIRRAERAFRDGRLRDALARYHGDNVDVAFWGWNRAWLDPDFRDWNVEHLLPGITAPLLLIQGRQDEYGTPAQITAIERQVSGPAETLWLDPCAHNPARERAETVVPTIYGFLEGHSLLPADGSG